jgi:hypothetical protein
MLKEKSLSLRKVTISLLFKASRTADSLVKAPASTRNKIFLNVGLATQRILARVKYL